MSSEEVSLRVFNQFVDLRSAQQIFGAEAADHGIEETADANGIIFIEEIGGAFTAAMDLHNPANHATGRPM